eukprot:2419141-Rhodomonas_salina.1
MGWGDEFTQTQRFHPNGETVTVEPPASLQKLQKGALFATVGVPTSGTTVPVGGTVWVLVLVVRPGYLVENDAHNS